MKNQNFANRLSFALNGIKHAFKNESSFRAQLLLAVIAIVYFYWLGVTMVWWTILIMIIALILAMELLNTSIEALADHLHPEVHPTIKIVKDLAAGAVLILSVAAVIFAVLTSINFWH
ncbi:diacylglycerol kinase [Thiomicrorhabdus heinhorstiae]|uniref:Diacylglycerol kinase n=1 Tax=Thiomicrorhabdus heinhorstiae TaxID=2748010 RepID=A0ABS0BXI3_9GAMM|nr:diacylglycerol kinase [Thiomicrorhabdus heinhorstiae]MBF6058500.1 diacylglycerol kinase [Thiomicrorhabdus heinhorstiae]